MPQPRKPPKDGDAAAKPPPDEVGKVDPEKEVSIEQDLAVTRERLEGVTRERDQLKEITGSLEQKLAEATASLTDAQHDLGRLEEVLKQRDALAAERDDLQSQLRELQTLTDQRITSAVRSAVAKTQAESRATVVALTDERDALSKRVAELEEQVQGSGATSRVTPTVLANRFADLLEQVGAGRQTDKPFSAALTSLEVEAKAILEAPREGEDEPLLRTVESGDVNPEQLSTVRMSFRLLPRLAAPPE